MYPLFVAFFVFVLIMIRFGRSIPPLIYDKLILHMTEVWYRAVLTRVDNGSTILDIGIGTAGALLRCKDLLVSKDITVVGIDYNQLYVEAAQKSVAKEQLEDRVRVEFMSVYDMTPGNPFPIQTRKGTNDGNGEEKVVGFDAAYFSGSLTLLPDPPAALRTAAKLLKKPNGLVYVTMTYQFNKVPFLDVAKPMLKYVTSIDFGQLVMENEVEEKLWRGSGMKVLEHKTIPKSLNNYFQAAFLTILDHGNESNDQSISQNEGQNGSKKTD